MALRFVVLHVRPLVSRSAKRGLSPRQNTVVVNAFPPRQTSSLAFEQAWTVRCVDRCTKESFALALLVCVAQAWQIIFVAKYPGGGSRGSTVAYRLMCGFVGIHVAHKIVHEQVHGCVLMQGCAIVLVVIVMEDATHRIHVFRPPEVSLGVAGRLPPKCMDELRF